MTTTTLLDPADLPLEGMHLIEASAGTGKTHTITSLYLRLLLEKGLEPENILVVTFTEAATLELKDRILSRLQKAIRRFGGQSDSSDPFIDELLGKHGGEDAILAARGKLQLAATAMDLASIFTIHGFCLRTLVDCAFESGSLFDLAFTTDDSRILRETVDDFWRRESPRWSQALHGYLHGRRCDADTLYAEVSMAQRRLLAVGEDGLLFGAVMEPEKIDAGLIPILRDIWRKERGEILALLQSPALSKAADQYGADNVAAWTALLDDYFFKEDGEDGAIPVEAILAFSTRRLVEGTKPSMAGNTPEHSFFEHAERLARELAMATEGIRRDLIHYCVREFPEKKKQKKMLSFNDLILDLRNALRHPEYGARLAASIRRKYPAALIDEFQDTDPSQFEIFQRVYHHRGSYPLLMIGDPKQAIYGFRGADVFAYIQASRSPEVCRHGLDTNWRSEPGLVSALNTLFGLRSSFVFPEIEFTPVKPASPARARTTTSDAAYETPLTFIRFPPQQNRDKARRTVATAAASEAARLLGLAGRGAFAIQTTAGGETAFRPLSAGDIAILTRTHLEGELVRKALWNKGVRSVMHSRDSIYSTSEAWELELLLAAIQDPMDTAKVRSALSTSFFGYASRDFIEMEKEGHKLDRLVETFLACQKIWRRKGPAVMLHHLFQREKAYHAIAGYRQGERHVTNVRHLFELLQSAAHGERLGPEEQLALLRARRRQEGAEDETQLRLESDENLVKIVTIHKSKGLEYPVVICPFAWDGGRDTAAGASPPLFCHADGGKAVIDFGSPRIAQHRERYLEELLAEELRLLYVALTRAKNRCLLFWGKVGSEKRNVSALTPLAYLLSALEETPDVDRSGQDLSMDHGDDAFFSPVNTLVRADGNISLRTYAEEGDEAMLPECPRALLMAGEKRFSGSFGRNWSVISFSAILRRDEGDPEQPDHDGLQTEFPRGAIVVPAPTGTNLSFYDFPRGARAGSCLHEIFEEIDFSRLDDGHLAEVAAEKLAAHGFDAAWLETVAAAVRAVCHTDLDPRLPGLRLGALPRHQRLDELEFHYAIPEGDWQNPRTLFCPSSGEAQKNASEAGNDVSWKYVPGKKGLAFMKGFIDLVFEWNGRYYLVDYKSNYLGPRKEDYGGNLVAGEMEKEGYLLQCHIYALALHRYLRARLGASYRYETHFGGAYYLFMRGMHPDHGSEYGIYHSLPRKDHIERIDLLLTPFSDRGEDGKPDGSPEVSHR